MIQHRNLQVQQGRVVVGRVQFHQRLLRARKAKVQVVFAGQGDQIARQPKACHERGAFLQNHSVTSQSSPHPKLESCHFALF